MDGTPSVNMRAILLLTILMTSGDFDKQKQEQFEKERPLFQRNHQKRLPQLDIFVDLANHLSAKTSTQLPIVKPLNNTLETDPAHISHKLEESLTPRTSVTNVVLSDTGSSTVQKKQKKGVPAQNEVLPFINTNYCLETYEYDNEIHCVVVIHNMKGRLKQNINFWKEKLLLADSSRNLVLPILEYSYFFTI